VVFAVIGRSFETKGGRLLRMSINDPEDTFTALDDLKECVGRLYGNDWGHSDWGAYFSALDVGFYRTTSS
jgi:hypothetical protein